MPIEQEPFRKYNLDEEKDKADTFTVRLSPEERADLEACKKILEQKRDSTAIKQLASIGSKVLHDNLLSNILPILFKNKRNNKRHGIVDFE